jgi:hypothetical protein
VPPTQSSDGPLLSLRPACASARRVVVAGATAVVGSAGAEALTVGVGRLVGAEPTHRTTLFHATPPAVNSQIEPHDGAGDDPATTQPGSSRQGAARVGTRARAGASEDA